VVTIPPEAQLDFVVPLTFFLLLVLVIRTRPDLLVAVVSVGLAVTFSKLGLRNTAVLLTGILGPLVGLAIGERGK
jgi:predicted branched-subunit amino acid permease